ncbi:MAG TPA: xanthine dehydrogenase family protein molybdopterin-binding subunit [Frankiaceae bacterium]|jgi:carbon-monoxide dehydrogenase large subunit|nr:xanthine dehydrogenase family protein molybdopterin-binding subunit [Frankiaceae bacterium]
MTAPDSAAARYTGARVHRVEDARLLTGRGTFVDDIVRSRMAHACFVRSPLASARIVAIDACAALEMPGVQAVFTADDLNSGVHESWYSAMGKHVPDTPRPPLAEGFVRFVGDPVALVIAGDRYVAEDAVDAVEVEYDPLPAVADYATARDAQALVHEGYPANVAGGLGTTLPDALSAIFKDSAHHVSVTVHQQAYAAVPLETRGMVAEWSGDELTVWAATQSPHEVRAFLARLLGLAENRVRVIMRDTGGGFGQKVMPMREEMCIGLAAMKMRSAVKWIEDRRENLMTAGMSRHEHGETHFAFDADGAIRGAYIDHVQDIGAYPTPWPVGTAAAVGMLFPGPYRVPAAAFRTTSVFSNTSGRVAYRGPWQFESLAREVTLDIAARHMHMDPVELRQRNLLRRDELPYANPNGMPYSDVTPVETFEKALQMLDYDAFRREQAVAREQGRYLGVGMCNYIEPTASAMSFYGTEGATIRIEPSGTVNVYVAGGSTGNSLETAAVQLTADALGVNIADVRTIQGDTAVTPFGAGTGGSRSGSMIAGAVEETAAILRERIVAIAAEHLEAAPGDMELADSHARVKGSPTNAVPLTKIAEIAYFMPHKLPAGIPAGLEASARYQARSPVIWANASHVCTCEVDIVTGAVNLLRYIVSEDCGPMINPSVVEGQIAGGVVQGIGGVLFEHLPYDEDGNPLATTFMDYLLPTACDVPTIEYGHVETAAPGPGGFKGVGEGGAIGAPPAVVNAIADALAPLGVEVTRLPLTPAAIRGLIEAAR